MVKLMSSDRHYFYMVNGKFKAWKQLLKKRQYLTVSGKINKTADADLSKKEIKKINPLKPSKY